MRTAIARFARAAQIAAYVGISGPDELRLAPQELIDTGHAKTAKAFILHRDRRRTRCCRRKGAAQEDR